MEAEHQPVLLKEVITGLAIKPNGIYVDATFGRGGHSFAILEQLGPNGRLIAMDQDPDAIAVANKGPFADPRVGVFHTSFTNLQRIVTENNLQGKVDGILLDLGVSSPQLETPERGFSFLREGPLDMRMNPQQGMDASTWINHAAESEIAQVLKEYGEERHARRIAAAIINARKEQEIKTTTQLAGIIAKANPSREKKKHPATRSFQAIRIFINNELENLQLCLEQCVAVLSVGGRMCVISFHSLEDRIVKRFIQNEAKKNSYPPDLPILAADMQNNQRLRKIGSLVQPSAEEIKINPRARSACLRIAEKIA